MGTDHTLAMCTHAGPLREALLFAAALAVGSLPLLVALILGDRSPAAARCAVAVPPVVSLMIAPAACGAWAIAPARRSAHLGHSLCLTAASGGFSASWLGMLFADELGLGRCDLYKAALACWLASWLWHCSLACDWLLLLQGDRRSGSGVRRALSLACHLLWPLAVAMALPLLRTRAEPVTLAPPTRLPCCALRLDALAPRWWPWALAAVLGSIALSSTAAYACTLHRAATAMPRVVWDRHRRHAACMHLSLLVLQPASAALFAASLTHDRDGAAAAAAGGSSVPSVPPFAPGWLALWVACAGAPWAAAWQGGVALVWHLSRLPGAQRRVSEPSACGMLGGPMSMCGLLLGCGGGSEGEPCRRGGGCCCCCAMLAAATDAEHGWHTEGTVGLTHMDSRFVHFASRRSDEEERADVALVRRALEEEREAVPFRLALGLVPAALGALGLGLVLALHL